MSAELVECRVPACRRPELLRRALRSLQAQTHPAWQAVVLDDSPDGEAAAVVRECGDPRVTCRQNPRPLGAAGNLDAAFAAAPLLGGQFAFVLEDDNAVDPAFIATGLRLLAETETDILSFNQRSVRFDPDGREIPLGVLRPHQTADETWNRDRLWLNAFLGVSLPNGGYFWRLGHGVDLAVGAEIGEPQLQECVRQTRPAAILLAAAPLSVWSWLPSAGVRRQTVDHRRFAVSLNRLALAVRDRLGEARLRAAAQADSDPAVQRRLELSLAELGLLSPRRPGSAARAPLAAFRCWLRQALYRDATRFDRVLPILP